MASVQDQYKKLFTKTKKAIKADTERAILLRLDSERAEQAQTPDKHYQSTAGLDLSEITSSYDVDRRIAIAEAEASIAALPDGYQPYGRLFVNRMKETAEILNQETFAATIHSTLLTNLAAQGMEGSPLYQQAEQEKDLAQSRAELPGAQFDAIRRVFSVMSGRAGALRYVRSAWYNDPSRTPQELEDKEKLGRLLEPVMDAYLTSFGIRLDDILALDDISVPVKNVTLRLAKNSRINPKAFGFNLNSGTTDQISLEEIEYGVQSFDLAFGHTYDDAQKTELAETGLDQFDMITIGGKSANALFADKYKDQTPERREQLMKCEIIKASLNAQQKIACARIEGGKITEMTPIHTECHLEQKKTFGQRFRAFFGAKIPTKQDEINKREKETDTPEETLSAKDHMLTLSGKIAAKVIDMDNSFVSPNAKLYTVSYGLSGEDENTTYNNLAGNGVKYKSLNRVYTRNSLFALYAMTKHDLSLERAFDPTYIGSKPSYGRELTEFLKTATPEQAAQLYADMGAKLASLPVPDIDPDNLSEMTDNYETFRHLRGMAIDLDQVFTDETKALCPTLPGMTASAFEKQETVLNLMSTACNVATKYVLSMSVDPEGKEAETTLYLTDAIKSRALCEYAREHCKVGDYRTLEGSDIFSMQRLDGMLTACDMQLAPILSSEQRSEYQSEFMSYIRHGNPEFLYQSKEDPLQFSVKDPNRTAKLKETDQTASMARQTAKKEADRVDFATVLEEEVPERKVSAPSKTMSESQKEVSHSAPARKK